MGTQVKYQNKYRIKPARLEEWDYGANGAYFITICTKNMNHLFGEIPLIDPKYFSSKLLNNYPDEPQVNLTEIGNIANDNWCKISEYYPFVVLDEFIVMPNHIHGILFISKKEEMPLLQNNKYGPQSGNLASIMRGYKASVKSYATTNNINFNWQSRFYDRVIRSEIELNKIREYIRNNPAKWEFEKGNVQNLFM